VRDKVTTFNIFAAWIYSRLQICLISVIEKRVMNTRVTVR